MSTKTLLDAATFFLTSVNELRSEQATVAGALLSAKQYNGVNTTVITEKPTSRDDLTKVEQEQYFRLLRRFSPIAPVDRIIISLIGDHLQVDFSTGETSKTIVVAIPDVAAQPVIVDIELPEKDTTIEILTELEELVQMGVSDITKPWSTTINEGDDLHESLLALMGDSTTSPYAWFDVHYDQDRLEVLMHVPDSITVKRLVIPDLDDAIIKAGE